MVKGDEDRLRQRILNELQKVLKDYKYRCNLQIDEKVKVLKDVTVIPYDTGFKLVLGFAEVDIAIFQENKKLTDELRDLKNVILRGLGKRNIVIPYILFELKSGELTSDAIQTKNIICRDIKDKFPYTHYIFLGDNTPKQNETLFRQGKAFSSFHICKNEISFDRIHEIIRKEVMQKIGDLIRGGIIREEKPA